MHPIHVDSVDRNLSTWIGVWLGGYSSVLFDMDQTDAVVTASVFMVRQSGGAHSLAAFTDDGQEEPPPSIRHRLRHFSVNVDRYTFLRLGQFDFSRLLAGR